MKLSLRRKVILVVILFTIILSVCAVLVSYRTYTSNFRDHYESLATSIVRATATVVDQDHVKTLADQIRGTFYDVCAQEGGVPDFDSFSDADWEAYYAHFAPIAESEAYQDLLAVLSQLREDYGVVSLYLGYTDIETKKDLYLVDASEPGEQCFPGHCDDVEAEHLALVEAGNFDFPAFITNYPDYGWLCSASAPVRDENGTPIAVALADISMNEIMADAQSFLHQLVAVIAAAALVMSLLILFLVDRVVVVPVTRLTNAASTFISGKQEGQSDSDISRLEIHTGDEIETLCRSIKSMERELNTYITDLTQVTAEKERIGAELNVATNIQASMLPCIFPAFPGRPEIDIYATMAPAKEVGGDFYDFFLVDDDHLAVIIADVSGKGVPAALFMVIAKTLIKDHAQTGSAPEDVFAEVNRQLCESNDEGLFVTAWMGILEISTGKVTFVNAGHNPPLIGRAGQEYEYLQLRPGFVLAGMDMTRYKPGTFELRPGDSLYLYTDGVTEATDAHEELYGEDRLKKVLDAHLSDAPAQLLPAVKSDIDAFVGEAPQFDDITMVSVRYLGPGAH